MRTTFIFPVYDFSPICATKYELILNNDILVTNEIVQNIPQEAQNYYDEVSLRHKEDIVSGHHQTVAKLFTSYIILTD